MKRMFSYIIVCVLIVTSILSGCSKKDRDPYDTPEKTIEQLEEALNSGDLEELIQCFDENTGKVLSGGSKILGSLIGLDFDGIVEILLGLHGMVADDIKRDAFSLDTRDISYTDKKHCIVSVYVEVIDVEGNREEEMSEIPMVLEDDGWKIKLSLKDLGLE